MQPRTQKRTCAGGAGLSPLLLRCAPPSLSHPRTVYFSLPVVSSPQEIMLRQSRAQKREGGERTHGHVQGTGGACGMPCSCSRRWRSSVPDPLPPAPSLALLSPVIRRLLEASHLGKGSRRRRTVDGSGGLRERRGAPGVGPSPTAPRHRCTAVVFCVRSPPYHVELVALGLLVLIQQYLLCWSRGPDPKDQGGGGSVPQRLSACHPPPGAQLMQLPTHSQGAEAAASTGDVAPLIPA